MNMESTVSDAVAELGGKYLTFRLTEEEYGIEILKVREIFGMLEITAVPGVPDYVKGVINLRGRIIPVIDLRLKFGFEEAAYNKETCIIVVSIDEILVGIIVDTVSEVVDIPGEDIELSPSFGAETPTEYLLGMGKVKERVVILMDVENVFSVQEITSIEDASEE